MDPLTSSRGKGAPVRAVRTCLLLLAVAVLVLTGSGSALAAPGYAPLDRPGPPLSVPAAKLAASLNCSGPLTGLRRNPILLVPGTTMNPQVNFDWNYERAFGQRGWRWCTVTLPFDATGDIQVAGDYLVNALRKLSAKAHRKV